MRDLELFADGSGGVCTLEVVSLPFTAVQRFFFDSPPLYDFIESLEELQQSLVGEVTLGQQFEKPYVSFRGDGRGHIHVQGTLMDQTEHDQRLAFSFATDQTALGPFISGLRQVANVHAA